MATKQYWVKVGDKVRGPFSPGQLRRLAAEGKLLRDHEVGDDQSRWCVARRIKDLSFGSTNEATPEGQSPVSASSDSQESKTGDEASGQADVDQLLGKTVTQQTRLECLQSAPRRIAIACGIWVGFGVLTAINAVAGLIVCLCIGVAALNGSVNKSFNLAILAFGGVIGIGVALMIAGGLADAGRNALRAKSESLAASATISLAAGAALGLTMLGFAIAALTGWQTTILRDAKVPFELARFLKQGLSITLFTGTPLLIWAGSLARRHHAEYDAWRTECWKHIPDDSPERATAEEKAKAQQLARQQQTIETLSRILPLDRFPEEQRWAATQWILGGSAVALLLGMIAWVYWVQATTPLR